MSIDQYSTTPSNNDLTNYFKTGMRPSSVKNAGWDIMADIASYVVSLPTAGGTSSAVTVTNPRPFGSLVTGLEQVLVPSLANAAGATFAPDGLTAKPIFNAGHAVVGNEMQPSTPIRLKYDGTNWNIMGQAVGAPGLLSGALEATIFTANGNFTPKTTGNYLVIGIGGGGGGGGGGSGTSTNGGSGGCGGAGGSIGFSIVSLTAATAYAVVIGAGGTAGSSPGGTGASGNDTTFNGVTIGAAGLGGQGGNSSTSAAVVGTPGTDGGGYGGGRGQASSTTPAPGTAGAANTGGGGGGGGSGNGAHTGAAGGAGGSGILIVIRA